VIRVSYDYSVSLELPLCGVNSVLNQECRRPSVSVVTILILSILVMTYTCLMLLKKIKDPFEVKIKIKVLLLKRQLNLGFLGPL